MNVLLVAPDAGSGGVPSVVRMLTRYLRAKGDNVQMLYSGASIFPGSRRSELGLPGLELRFQLPFGVRHPVVSLAGFAILFPIGLLQLIRLIRARRIQVVNIHYPGDDLFYFALCRRILRFTLVCSFHGADLFPGGKPTAKLSRSMQMLLRYSDWLVTPSEYMRQRLLQRFPEYADKTVFIHNGIYIAEMSHPVKMNAVPGGRYILSVSAYKEQKALDVLIRAMKGVSQSNPDVNLVLVGEGHLREKLESLAAELGLSDHIQFHGRKSQEQVVELLHGCQVFALPSRFEIFPVAVLEAMACHCPVVAANTGGIPEMIRNGYNGILVEPENPDRLADALNALLRDRALCLRLGEAGFEHVHRHFQADAMGSSYQRVFQAVSGLPQASVKIEHPYDPTAGIQKPPLAREGCGELDRHMSAAPIPMQERTETHETRPLSVRSEN